MMPGHAPPDRVPEIFAHYARLGELLHHAPHGNGHINDTFLLSCRNGSGERRYILQHINRDVFRDPLRVMRNVARVTGHLRDRLAREGLPDAERRVLCLLANDRGETHTAGADGEVWRLVHYVEGTRSHNAVDDAAKAREAGRAFGLFQSLLSDLPGTALEETIPHFHHTPRRLDALARAAREDTHGRAAGVREELAYALAQAGRIRQVTDGLADGSIPNRITHNDTKLNNVLLDERTGAAVCVIDLDTVMPGSVLYDFGDLVRTAANTAAEDESDLARVDVHLAHFSAVAEGYLSVARQFLRPAEIRLLPHSGFLLAYENGVRFLTDHLQGDVYFKIHHPGHNLQRCRAQFQLAQAFQRAETELAEIIAQAAMV
jgi:Ser/Thr protein kinase RdoA (MazF antagonist)